MNKFSPEVAPEDTVDLLQIIKGGVKMEILNDSVKVLKTLFTITRWFSSDCSY